MVELKLQLLDIYYKEHNTINDINQKYEVIVDNEVIRLGSFINDLRKQHKKYLLDPNSVSDKTKERIKYLERLNIDWTPKETEWMDKYYLLKEYKSVYGNIDIPYEYEINGVPLGVFLANQRALKRKNKTNEELEKHFKLLDKLGINWNPQDEDWNKKYELCKKYYEENKNLNLKDNFIYEGIDIGIFIANQRALYQKYKKGTLKRNDTTNLENHFKQLEKIGMIWYPNKSKQESIKQELLKYKEEKGNIDIPVNYHAIINNEDFALGMYISDSREIYRKNKNNLDKLNTATRNRIKLLEELGITWNPNEEYWNIRYNLLKEYKDKYGDIDIRGDYKTKYNEETINLGKFLNKQRELYRKHEKTSFKNCNDQIKNHFKLLNELGISWNPQKDEWKKQYEYLKYYYDKYGNLDISDNHIEKINGKKINIGLIYRNQKEAISKRRKEIEKGSATAEVMLRYSLLKQIGFKYTTPIETFYYEGEEYNKKELCNKLDIKISTFNKYLEIFNNNYLKAIRVCLLKNKVKESKKEKKKEEPTLDNMLESFDIDLDELDNYLSKEPLKEKQKRSNVILYKGSTTLRKYCIDNGYNYGVIKYALKVKQNKFIDEDLDKVIDRVLIDYNNKGQNKAPTWIYSKYGNELLLRHFLISLNLDYDFIIKDMSKNAITLEEAIRNNCFNLVSKKNKHNYLEGIFIDIINKYNLINEDKKVNEETKLEIIDEYIKEKVKEYNLNNKENNTLIDALNKYRFAIEKYHVYELGYISDQNKKIEIINKYNLSDKDIEDSFFVNINYENHSLIGKNSEEFKRRKAIKKLVRLWNNLNQDERINRINTANLNYPEDYNTITILRNKINHLQSISKKQFQEVK